MNVSHETLINTQIPIAIFYHILMQTLAVCKTHAKLTAYLFSSDNIVLSVLSTGSCVGTGSKKGVAPPIYKNMGRLYMR